MAQVTVYDVASRAGVSISTVSRVLNVPEKVIACTRLLVQAAIDDLAFVPKAETPARARKSHGRNGDLAPFFAYPSFAQRLGLENARDMAHRLLNLPEPPTAIFAASDTQAMGVFRAARERGLSVPKQLAVVGFDDLGIADLIGLTTIHQPLEESGRVAMDLLRARLADPSRPPQRIRLPLSLAQSETA